MLMTTKGMITNDTYDAKGIYKDAGVRSFPLYGQCSGDSLKTGRRQTGGDRFHVWIIDIVQCGWNRLSDNGPRPTTCAPLLTYKLFVVFTIWLAAWSRLFAFSIAVHGQ